MTKRAPSASKLEKVKWTIHNAGPGADDVQLFEFERVKDYKAQTFQLEEDWVADE